MLRQEELLLSRPRRVDSPRVVLRSFSEEVWVMRSTTAGWVWL